MTRATGAAPVAVLVALTGVDPAPVVRLAQQAGTVEVVAECVEVADLLVAAATGVGSAALVSAALPGLNRDVLARLHALRVGVVGVAGPDDGQATARLHDLGVSRVVSSDAGPADLAAALQALAPAPEELRWAFAGPATGRPSNPEPAAQQGPGQGRVVAVWGPTGAPGRTTVAIGLAAELAELGWPTLLVDADAYGGAVAPTLGLPDEASGVALACRQANRAGLDPQVLAALVQPVSPSLGALTGLGSAERWPELRPAALQVVLAAARHLAAVTVVDCGFCLERDEELSYDTLAPRRNGATLTTLEDADLVVAVGSADPVGLNRLVAGLRELREVVPEASVAVVVNRVRPSGLSEREVRDRLQRFAGVRPRAVLPHDLEAADATVRSHRPLPEAAPASALRGALQELSSLLVGVRRG